MQLSVITINYNNCAGLSKTLQSVAQQSFADFEYIVIDGGSTDGSKEAIEAFAQRYTKPLIWKSEKDTGIYNAMNKGLRQAVGEYCLFLNSGDCLLAPDTLAQVFQNDMQADIVYGYQFDDFGGEPVLEQCIDVPYISFDTLRGTHIPHQSTFIKRNALLRLGGYAEQYKIISDWAFVMKGLFKADLTIARIPTKVALYDTTGISSDADKTLQKQERSQFLHQEFPLFMPDYERWDRLNKNGYMKLVRFGRHLKNKLCRQK